MTEPRTAKPPSKIHDLTFESGPHVADPAPAVLRPMLMETSEKRNAKTTQKNDA